MSQYHIWINTFINSILNFLFHIWRTHISMIVLSKNNSNCCLHPFSYVEIGCILNVRSLPRISDDFTASASRGWFGSSRHSTFQCLSFPLLFSAPNIRLCVWFFELDLSHISLIYLSNFQVGSWRQWGSRLDRRNYFFGFCSNLHSWFLIHSWAGLLSRWSFQNTWSYLFNFVYFQIITRKLGQFWNIELINSQNLTIILISVSTRIIEVNTSWQVLLNIFLVLFSLQSFLFLLSYFLEGFCLDDSSAHSFDPSVSHFIMNLDG